MPKKQVYHNENVISGSPDEMPEKMRAVGKGLSTIDADYLEVVVNVRGFQTWNFAEWFTPRRLAAIGIVVSVLLFLLSLLLTGQI